MRAPTVEPSFGKTMCRSLGQAPLPIAKSHVPPGTTQGKHTFSDPKPKCSLQIAGDGSTIDMAPVESTDIYIYIYV